MQSAHSAYARKGGAYHILIQNKARTDNIVFTCAILHTTLIEHDKWEDDDNDDDIAADIPEHSMDERIIMTHIHNGPALKCIAAELKTLFFI
jgi:hypothetical protein